MSDRAGALLPRPISNALSSIAVAGAVLGSAGAAAPAEAQVSRLDGTERQVIRLINAQRRAARLPRVHASRALTRSSSAHSADMLKGNFFAHDSSDGMPFSARVRRYRRAARIGENLGYVPGSGGRGQAREIVSMWLKSPPHRAVILSRGYRRIGVGRRTGRLGSMRVTVFTADFASAR
jgi:uncharacterized protein YkwD